jgi:diguanylate cyclase (GGDEF)-like protein
MHLLADSATWIAVGVVGGAALLALAASMSLLALIFRRSTAGAEASEEERASPAGPADDDLLDALEGARAESRRARRLAEIASTIDLDEVLRRTLAAAAATARLDAAMLVVLQEGEEPLVATVGMTADEASRHPVSTSPSGEARAVRLTYRYGAEDERAREADDDLIRGGVTLPIHDEHGAALGSLAVFWRGLDRPPTDDDVACLEELAESCGPAIVNARRYREVRRLADIDGLTGLHNRRYFHETLERECLRSERYERRLALVILDIDDFKAINDRIGHLAGDEVLAAVAERLLSAIRRADIACRVGGDEFAVILPEAAERDAEQLYRRIQFAVGSGAAGPAERVRLSAGIAELRPKDDPVSFFQRADDALYAAKQEGKGQVRKADDAVGR